MTRPASAWARMRRVDETLRASRSRVLRTTHVGNAATRRGLSTRRATRRRTSDAARFPARRTSRSGVGRGTRSRATAPMVKPAKATSAQEPGWRRARAPIPSSPMRADGRKGKGPSQGGASSAWGAEEREHARVELERRHLAEGRELEGRLQADEGEVTEARADELRVDVGGSVEGRAPTSAVHVDAEARRGARHRAR